MVSVDTNVLVRLLVRDDATQARHAERAFSSHASGDGVFVTLIVVAELSWVLERFYSWERPAMLDAVTQLLQTDGVIVEDPVVLEQALARYATGKAQLADYLIAAKAEAAGATLLSFDKQLIKEGVAKAP